MRTGVFSVGPTKTKGFDPVQHRMHEQFVGSGSSLVFGIRVFFGDPFS